MTIDADAQDASPVTLAAARTARAIDLAIGERTDGPVFLAADGRRLDRHGAGGIVRGSMDRHATYWTAHVAGAAR